MPHLECALTLSPTRWSFVPETSSLALELSALKAELEKLRIGVNVTRAAHTAEPLRELSLGNVDAFDTLSGRPKWMRDLSRIFRSYLTSGLSVDPVIPLQQVWAVMVECQFS